MQHHVKRQIRAGFNYPGTVTVIIVDEPGSSQYCEKRSPRTTVDVADSCNSDRVERIGLPISDYRDVADIPTEFAERRNEGSTVHG